jgi:hypothetical protein
VGRPEQDDSSAHVPVIVTTAGGQEIGYIFVLSKQDDEHCKCWMTDSVVPIEPDETVIAPII